MSDELEVLAPSGASVPYRGETIDVLPLEIGMIPEVVRIARPVLQKIFAAVGDDAAIAEDQLIDLVLDLVENNSEQVFAAVAICTGREVSVIKRGQIDEFVLLAKKVFEVNRDFFLQKLVPLLGGRAAKWLRERTGVGQTPSSS